MHFNEIGVVGAGTMGQGIARNAGGPGLGCPADGPDAAKIGTGCCSNVNKKP